MQGKYIPRKIEVTVREALHDFPAAAILGPRQCGKSTLARKIVSEMTETVFLDLEKPSDVQKLSEPELFFAQHQGRLICLDEIQRVPDLFPILRSIIDEQRTNGQFLILGSASRDLIRQSAESLAGRIAYLELTPFLSDEVLPDFSSIDLLTKYWLRGGFPDSFLARSNQASLRWRDNFISTFLERDIPQLGITIPAHTLDGSGNFAPTAMANSSMHPSLA